MIDWIALALHGFLNAAVVPSKPSALAIEGCEFGEVYATTPAVCDISFSNSGETPINIRNFQVVSGSGTMVPEHLTVAPHSTAQARVEIDTSKSIGRNSYIVLFDSDPKSDRRSAKVNGYVLSTLDQGTPQVDLGVVKLAESQGKRDYQLSSHEVADFRINGVLSTPSWLATEIAPDGQSFGVSVKKDAPWGLQEDYVRIALNTPRQKEAFIKIKADVHGDVVPSSNPLNIGVVRLGEKNETLFRLNSLSHKKVNIGKIKLEGFKGHAESLSCQPATVDCKMIRLTVSDAQPTGSLKGTLWIDLPDYGTKLPVTTWGFLISKDYQIRRIENESAQSEVANRPPDIKSALKSIVAPRSVDTPPPSGNGPLLKWSVADAGSVYGFQIFRSNSENGPFILMNPHPIRADTENNDTQSFQWRDNDARAGSTYYYTIGILRISGKKEHLAGPQKVAVK